MERPRHLRGQWLPLLVALLTAPACQGGQPGESPVATVRHFLQAMDRSASDETGLAEAYALLDAGARKELTERSLRAAALTGLEYEPWRMLSQGRFRLRFAPASPGGLKERIAGDTAVVVATGAGASERAEIPLVREGGQWRIRLEIPPMHRSGP